MRSALAVTFKYSILLSVAFFVSMVFLSPVFSQSVEDLEKEVDKKNQEINEKSSTVEQVKKEIEDIRKSSVSLEEKIKLMEGEVGQINKYLEEKSNEVVAREELLERRKEQLGAISAVLYKRSRSSFIEYLLSSTEGEDFLTSILFKRFSVTKLVREMKDVSFEYAQLKQEKIDLEGEKEGLDEIMVGLKEEMEKTRAEIARRNGLVGRLGGQISLLKEEISELQATILLAKSGGTYISASDIPVGGAGGYNDFVSNAPSGSFGVFSIGAFTHRNGMSQWGAKARDDAGQTYLQILGAYYPGATISNGRVWNQDITQNISVQGHGSMPLETYLLGIREINGAWNNVNDINVLKAQVIAARTYAVRYTSNGQNPICTTQSCQVYSSNHYTGAWATAVAETAGQILVGSGNNPVLTQYAAVHGGWVNGVGWDTTNGQGGQSGWTANAWESKSGVNWFYKSWPGYQLNNGYSYGVVTCNTHPHPWLSGEEMADLVNTFLVMKGSGLKGSVNTSRILPVTLSSCPISGLSGSPYSMSEMRGLLNNPVTSVSSVSNKTTNGNTESVFFNTNAGTIIMSGSEFYQTYNIRAPGFLSVNPGPNSFIHVDIRKK